MRRICLMIAVTILATCAGLASSQSPKRSQRHVYKPQRGDFVVVCTLFKGRAPGATDSTPLEPITYDPHFEIGARIERVHLGDSPWRVGNVVTFVIHSPTLMLGHNFAGKQFKLTFSPFRPTSDDDKVWFTPETRYLLQWIEPVNSMKN